MGKAPYPSTEKEFRRHYETHTHEELLHAVALLSVRNLELVQELTAARKLIDSTLPTGGACNG